MPTADPFGLERFVTAQTPVFDTALAELKADRKRGHWMWFIFPQLRGLGHSSMARFYGIGSLDEAQAYLAHSLLGPRLTLCTEAVLASSATSLRELFGSPDDLKFRSSMTLFATATADDGSLYQKALDRWCGGQADQQTRWLLSQGVGD